MKKRINYTYGSYKKYCGLKGLEIPIGASKLMLAIEEKKKKAILQGTRLEKVYLRYIRAVYLERGWVRVSFHKGASIETKTFIRNWLINNGFTFEDKPYNWTEQISASTKIVSLGPWSKNPKYVSTNVKNRKMLIVST